MTASNATAAHEDVGYLEAIYERLAEALDQAGGPEDRDDLRQVFLAKFALLAARRIHDRAAVEEMIGIALTDLDPPDP